MELKQRIDSLHEEVQGALERATSLHDVEALKVKFLGKKGPLQQLLQGLRDCSAEERPAAGKLLNESKLFLEERFALKARDCLEREEGERLAGEAIDVTLPGRSHFLGQRHIALALLDEVLEILVGMGFSVQVGPEVETDYYNFEALNFGVDHPARDMQDTFYLTGGLLLRTHTSNVQVRVMEGHKPPLRVAIPGKCYRNEDVTARSHVIFHQVEALYIDERVSLGDLMGTLKEFLAKLFKREVELRFRPSYFPFVEPGMEVDVGCLVCGGSGCGVCKGSGWLEVLGAGMVHPEVMRSGGIDPEAWSGYAWGLGTERLAMLRYGVDDIRLFWQNDIRFLKKEEWQSGRLHLS